MTPELAKKRSRPAKSTGWIVVNDSRDHRGQQSTPQPLQAFHWRLADDTTVGLALVAATQRLASNGVDSPKLDSEVLLGHVLSCSRAQLYAHPERLLSEDERQSLERLVVRRCQQEPVAYLVGEKAFYGLDFFVDPRVLIPRPETELLVDMVLDVALQFDSPRSNGHNGVRPTAGRFLVADIGTGSGAVSVAVAANTSNTFIYAVDISQDALDVAQANARRHALESRIQFLHGDLLSPLPESVDLIVANLPYVAVHEWSELAPGIVNYEPPQALLGGTEGLDFISRLLEQAPGCLRPGGCVLLEIGASQGSAVGEMARHRFPDALIEVLTDYAFRERIVRIQA